MRSPRESSGDEGISRDLQKMVAVSLLLGAKMDKFSVLFLESE